MKNMRSTHLQEDTCSDEAWDNRELGASEGFVRKSSPEREKALDDALCLQTISIRLQKSLIEELKRLAEEDGIGYQPYIRQVLKRHARREKAKNVKDVQSIK